MISRLIKSLLQALSFGRFITKARSGKGNAIYITFDDGPNPEYTNSILDVLKEHNARATFFLIGDHVEQYPGLARRIINEGHQVGGHTSNHKLITEMSLAELVADLNKTRETILKHTGHNTYLFRPPRGRMSVRSIMSIMFSGYKIVHWSITYSDYLKDGAEKLMSRILSRLPENNDIVLLHDNNAHTLEVLPELLDKCHVLKLEVKGI
jgi:peptidoglycan/xylan/chitin deacetylase (PgdA/CDA1 family)